MTDPRPAPPADRPPTAAEVIEVIKTTNAKTSNAIHTLTTTMNNFLAALQPLLAFVAVSATNPTAAVNSVASPTRESPFPPGIKPPTPKQYSGNMKEAITWQAIATTATAATLTFANWDMHTPQVVQYASTFLTGHALRWWQGCCNTALASYSPLAASGGFAYWSELSTALTTALPPHVPHLCPYLRLLRHALHL